jgi:mono/diheme cytochrome c family protein
MRRLCLCVAVMLTAVPLALVADGGSKQHSATTETPQGQIKKTAAPYTPPSSGKEMYVAYCASCHGTAGKGDGPAAPAMKVPPSDLTRLAAINGGKFPESHVVQTINGDAAAPGHGSKDMPVWGPVFRAMGSTSDGVAQLRVRNLTQYIASLQQK